MSSVWLIVLVSVVSQPAPARVHGRVTDPSGALLVGAAVVVTDDQGHIREGRTDRQGGYTIDRLAAGSYSVMASAPGFADAQQSIALASAQDLTLDLTLAIDVQRQTVTVEAGATTIGIDPTANANAMILKGKDLDALSDDPAELEAQLHALAGASAGPTGAQIYIDGFTGGSLPPKSAILEIRVNQNPYSAEYDAPGSARVEIITKAGGRSLHGRFLADLNRAGMNSRNPFLAQTPA